MTSQDLRGVLSPPSSTGSSHSTIGYSFVGNLTQVKQVVGDLDIQNKFTLRLIHSRITEIDGNHEGNNETQENELKQIRAELNDLDDITQEVGGVTKDLTEKMMIVFLMENQVNVLIVAAAVIC